MFIKVFSLCLFVTLFAAGSSLSCQWMNHKFRQCSENALNLLEMMAHNSTNSSDGAAVSFPNELYSQASKASAEHKLGFTIQVLEEVSALFEEDHSSASWEKVTVEHFLSVVTRQAEGLRSCIGSHKKNKKLQMYFKRLSHHVTLVHGAEAWELIRKEIKIHLMRTDHMVSSLLN